MTEAMPFLQKYDITFLRPPTISAGDIFSRSLPGSRSLSPSGEIPAGAPKICKHHSSLADFYFFVLHSSLFTSL